MPVILTYSTKDWITWRWALITPLGRPVVPEVNIRSEVSSGLTAAARTRASASVTPAPEARKSAQEISACTPLAPMATTFSRFAGRQSASIAG